MDLFVLPQRTKDNWGFKPATKEEIIKAFKDNPTRWICLADDEFSCNGYLAGAIEDKSLHSACGEFILVKINESPI